MMEEHPEKSGNVLSLGGKPLMLWEEQLGRALSRFKSRF